jgi:hypothetical protein
VSPRRPPTANATMTERDDGSILGGHNASKKSKFMSVQEGNREKESHRLGGPEIYRVASRALMAGLLGKRMEKIWEAQPEVDGFILCRCRFRSCTSGHCYHNSVPPRLG